MNTSTPHPLPEPSAGPILCPSCGEPAHPALMSKAAFCLNRECTVIVIDLTSPATTAELSNTFIAESLANTPAEKHSAVWTLIGRDAEAYEKEINE